MKILITGATGFMGRNLLSSFLAKPEGDVVYGVMRQSSVAPCRDIRWVSADLSETDWTRNLPDEDFDVVIHLAQSLHYRNFPAEVKDIFAINVRATIEVAEWARQHNVARFLFASTGNVYGQKDGEHFEDDCCSPETMYGASKLSAEMLLKPFSEFMEILALRFFGVYGPGQTGAMLPGVIEKFNTGQEIVLAQNIGVNFNPIFIDDCVSAIRQLASVALPKRYEIVNIGGPEHIDLRVVSDLLERFGGKTAAVRITEEEPKQLLGATRRMQQLCNITEAVSFSEGLRRTFNFSSESLEAP